MPDMSNELIQTKAYYLKETSFQINTIVICVSFERIFWLRLLFALASFINSVNVYSQRDDVNV